ncbi:MAG: DNA/RNA non-specific endonuclease [Bacteroidia bacterium]
MKKLFFLLSFNFLLASLGIAQIIVSNAAYKANFSNTYHVPKYVSYYLYKGGGPCDRKPFHFKNDRQDLLTASDDDYSHSGYEKGHLANAEDFAFDCIKDEMTFRYYNCLPQTANLNKGPWKSNETLVREWSQKEKLYIICGGVFGSATMGNGIAIPSFCWKVVQSAKTKKILYCGWFSNTNHATEEEITVTELEKRLKTKIVVLK